MRIWSHKAVGHQVEPDKPQCFASENCCFPLALSADCSGEWRNVAIKFDIEHKSCDVTIGTTEIIKDLKLESLHLPKRVCAGVCAGTSKNYRAGFRVNKLVLRGDKA